MSQDFAVVEWLFYSIDFYRKQVVWLEEKLIGAEGNDREFLEEQLSKDQNALAVLGNELDPLLVEGCDSLVAFYNELVDSGIGWGSEDLQEDGGLF